MDANWREGGNRELARRGVDRELARIYTRIGAKGGTAKGREGRGATLISGN